MTSWTTNGHYHHVDMPVPRTSMSTHVWPPPCTQDHNDEIQETTMTTRDDNVDDYGYNEGRRDYYYDEGHI